MKFVFSRGTVYALWHEGAPGSFDDEFVTDENGLLRTFATLRDAEAYAKDRGLALDADPPVAYVCDVFALPPRDTAECNADLGLWNLFSDVAHSTGALFIGDFGRGGVPDDVDAVYEKLFHGSNLPAMRRDGREYRPRWTAAETALLKRILEEGCAITRRGLGLSGDD